MSHSEDDKKVGRGEKVSGAIDARSTTRNDEHAWQNNRSAEWRVESGQVAPEEVIDWKSRFRKLSGFMNSQAGVLSLTEGAIQIRLGDRYHQLSNAKPNKGVLEDIASMSQFVLHTRPELLKHVDMDKKYLDAYDNFCLRLAGLKSVFLLLTEPQEAPRAFDEATTHFFQTMNRKFSESVRNRIGEGGIKDRLTTAVYGENSRIARKREQLRKIVPSIGSSIVSRAHYFSRFFPTFSEDPDTLKLLHAMYDEMRELAQFVNRKAKEFSRGSEKIDPLSEIPAVQREEAKAIWKDLLHGDSDSATE